MPTQTAIVAPTENQVAQAQREAISQAEQLAGTITGIGSQQEALVREILPDADLASGAQNGWTATDREWIQSGLTADNVEEVYSVDSNNEAQDKVLVFYGLANPASTVITTEVIFQDGTGATFARFNVESLDLVEISDIILFDELIVYGSTEDGTINQWLDAAGADQMIYLAKVAEPLGQTLATREPTDRRLAGRNRGRA